jgi:SAM-dependent methyltransferase
MGKTASYDGLAEWYDSWIQDTSRRGAGEDMRALRALLGRGPGKLLDQGCGGGRLLPLFAELGWTVMGIDESEDQLRVAQPRADAAGAELRQASATELPFEDESFDAVAAVLVSTDIEPWERLVSEAARVLRPGGRFVHVGTHPSFVGPHSAFDADGERWIVGKGYRDRRRQFDLPAFRPEGIRIRVGAVHVPLDDFLNGIVDAGLRITLVREGRDADPPWLFGVRAEKP